jgi:glycosyltransferase involved in cell wall biosynthesis
LSAIRAASPRLDGDRIEEGANQAMTFFARRPMDASSATATTVTPPRPTILFVSPVADLKGGAERVLLDLLDNPAIRPALAVPGEGELAELARKRGYPLRFFDLGAVASVHRPPRPRELLNAADGLRRCARQLAVAAGETGASLLHTNGLKVHVVGGMARLVSRVPVIAHLHDIPYTFLEKTIWRGIAAAVTRTVIVSRPCFPGAVQPDRVTILPNGLRSTGLTPEARVLSDTPTIGFVGRFHPFKGLHLLLDWFEQASCTRPELRLLIRGRADQEGADYWQSLQDRLAYLSNRGCCQVLGWAGPGEDPYQGIDLLAVPSRTPDPSPLVILEAMMRGIPSIGYPAGGIPTLIGGPEYGALAANAAEFEAGLMRLLDPQIYRAASAAAGARVRETFTIERFWNGINAQYALAGVAMPALPTRHPLQMHE